MLNLDLAPLLFAFAAAAAAALVIVLTQHLHQRWTADFEASGVQKHHQGSPPRVGSLALGLGVLTAAPVLAQSSVPGAADGAKLLGWLALCSIPAVGSGLMEDLTKTLRARWRLLAAALSASLGMLVFGALVPSVGVTLLDPLVQWWPAGVALTMLLVTGFTHAMNIVDGLNGLASGLALMMLAATGYVAYGANDLPLAQACALLAAVVLGFAVVNFPRGLIFLGDGGAYFLGFALAQIWVLLLVRNPGEISPWFCIAVAFHPTMETIFSILRRKLRPCKRDATAPDRLHLHTLVYRRKAMLLMRPYSWAEKWVGNALAALVVVLLALPPLLASTWHPGSNAWQFGVVVVGAALYLLYFVLLVRVRPWRKLAPKATPLKAEHASEKLQQGSH